MFPFSLRASRILVGAVLFLLFLVGLLISRSPPHSEPVFLSETCRFDHGAELHAATTRPLIVYAFHDTPDARGNAAFFVRHGVHPAADFLFIANGDGSYLTKLLRRHLAARTPNVALVVRANECYDLGAYAQVLNADGGALRKKHDRFVLLNSSVRGPFIPPLYSTTCWSDAYLGRITDTVKLVGISLNCNSLTSYVYRPHVQSMLLATDRVGLTLLLDGPGGFAECPNTWRAAVAIELATADRIWAAGYDVDVAMTAFHAKGLYDDLCSCVHDNPLGKGAYFGTTMHPYETMFAKTKHPADLALVEQLTKIHDRLKPVSPAACAAAGRAISDRT
ncbi:hypothetical protein BDZ88DRAFT_445140 [Geranomyces variabilis]|nr:hypothetical protein BDZ88DRAFT_445140 [Geranomyces variabilis]